MRAERFGCPTPRSFRRWCLNCMPLSRWIYFGLTLGGFWANFTPVDSKKLQSIDISHLREDLKTIQEKILKFKTQNDAHFNKLQEEEKYLSLKVGQFERLLPSYEKAEVNLQTAPKNNHSFSIYQGKNEDVINYEKFLLDYGGHFGGWEEEDHLLFLQFRKKFKVKSVFLDALKLRLPGIPEKDILEHEKWYSDYLFLREKQRIAVKKWRAEKEEEKAKQRRSGAMKTISKTKVKVNKQFNAERKQRLEEWKRRKLEKEGEAEEAAQKAIEERFEKAFERKQLQDMKRAAVEIYRKEKMCKQNAYLLKREFKELKEREGRAAHANMLLKTFREHDESYIERRRQLRAGQVREKEDKAKRLDESRRRHSRQLVARDPERLLQPTLSWLDRLQSKQTDIAVKPILHLRNTPHLGTPNWRKVLTF